MECSEVMTWVYLLSIYTVTLSNNHKIQVASNNNGLPLLVQMVKNLLAIQEIRVWSLSQEDPLEKWMTAYSSIFAWRIPWTEEPDRLQSMGLQRAGHNWATKHKHVHVYAQLNHFAARLTLTQHCKYTAFQFLKEIFKNLNDTASQEFSSKRKQSRD